MHHFFAFADPLEGEKPSIKFQRMPVKTIDIFQIYSGEGDYIKRESAVTPNCRYKKCINLEQGVQLVCFWTASHSVSYFPYISGHVQTDRIIDTFGLVGTLEDPLIPTLHTMGMNTFH